MPETEKKVIKVWEQEPTDIMRFVITRQQWDSLITGLASACSRNDDCWAGLDVLRNAAEDIDASEMAHCLRQVVDFTAQRRNLDEQLANNWAKRGLKAANIENESTKEKQ